MSVWYAVNVEAKEIQVVVSGTKERCDNYLSSYIITQEPNSAEVNHKHNIWLAVEESKLNQLPYIAKLCGYDVLQGAYAGGDISSLWFSAKAKYDSMYSNELWELKSFTTRNYSTYRAFIATSYDECIKLANSFAEWLIANRNNEELDSCIRDAFSFVWHDEWDAEQTEHSVDEVARELLSHLTRVKVNTLFLNDSQIDGD